MVRRNGSSSNAALLLGGVAAGIIGSRLLPPIIAGLIGRRRSTGGADPFSLLVDDHRKILSILDQMLLAPADSKLQRSRLFLMLKRKLAKHALAEEDIVYPILHDQAHDADSSKHLYDEHADMKVHLHEIEQRIMSGDNWNSVVEPLRDLIRRHADEEEEHVFPSLRRQLNSSQLPKISGQISREEAMIL